MGSVHEIQASRNRPPLNERDLQLRNEHLEHYVARLLGERVRIVICSECQTQREEARQ